MRLFFPAYISALCQTQLSASYQGLQLGLPELATPPFDSILGNVHNLSIF